MRLFLFAIGGTGARVVRSLTMMLASGIDGLDSSTEIIPIIIDFDKSNGDKDRAINALDSYVKIHNQLYPNAIKGTIYDSHFFMTTIQSLKNTGVINGGPQMQKDYEIIFDQSNQVNEFSKYLGLDGMVSNPAEKMTMDLFHTLYDDSPKTSSTTELNLNLNVGFKGNPNIGSVVFHELRNLPELQRFFTTFNASQGDKVFIVSSIFGGTGSSGFPEIVNAIRSHNNEFIKNAIIGSAVVLPYFDVNTQNNQSGNNTGAINSSTFPSKSVAALTYYSDRINNTVNAIYYVGDENHDSYDYSEGSQTQQNKAHVVEVVAATAIIDFLKRNVTLSDHNAYEFGIKDEKKNESILYPDFYQETHRLILDRLSAFALGVKFYRDRICGDRSQESKNTAYYSNNGFSLASKLHDGVFQTFDEFIDPQYDNGASDHWGFYPWLNELVQHAHKLDLFKFDRNIELKDILSYQAGQHGGFFDRFKSSPASDSNFSGAMNTKSKNLPSYSESDFFKVLHDVSEEIFNALK